MWRLPREIRFSRRRSLLARRSCRGPTSRSTRFWNSTELAGWAFPDADFHEKSESISPPRLVEPASQFFRRYRARYRESGRSISTGSPSPTCPGSPVAVARSWLVCPALVAQPAVGAHRRSAVQKPAPTFLGENPGEKTGAEIVGNRLPGGRLTPRFSEGFREKGQNAGVRIPASRPTRRFALPRELRPAGAQASGSPVGSTARLISQKHEAPAA